MPWCTDVFCLVTRFRPPCSGITQCSGALIGVQRQHVLTTGQCVLNSSTSQVQLQRLEIAKASSYGC
jgi:hypothetical protein